MIAPDAELQATQLLANGRERFDRTETKVAEEKDGVLGSDERIPVVDEGLVHGGGVGEGTAGVPDDVGVREVGVGNEPGFHEDGMIGERGFGGKVASTL